MKEGLQKKCLRTYMFFDNKKNIICITCLPFFFSDMVEILDKDRTDEEALSYALDTLSNICSPEEFEEEIVDSRPVQDMSRPRCEIFVFFLFSFTQNNRKIY